MSKQMDHVKAAKAAKISKQGAEFIDPSDRTLSAAGYPSAQDMARSLPKRRLRGPDVPPRIYKQESVEEFRATVLRADQEKKLRRNRKTVPSKAEVHAAVVDEKIGNNHEEVRRLLAKQCLELAVRTTPINDTNVAGARRQAPLTVVQELSRAQSRIIQVEIKPGLGPRLRRSGKDQDQKR